MADILFSGANAWMTISLLLPLLAALAAAFLRHPNLRDSVQLLLAALLVASVHQLFGAFEAGEASALVLTEFLPGVSLRFALDGYGIIFMLVVAVLWLVALVYSGGYMRANHEAHQCRFYACYAVAIAATLGLAMSGNMFTLFLCYEILTLSTFPLVAHHGTPEAKRGARTYLFILLGTSILLQMFAILWTYTITGSTDFTEGGLLAGNISPAATGILLALYMYGIGKAALMPFHRWLPAAMVAPAPVSALLHAVAVVKAGVFTAIKVVTGIFGVEALQEAAQSGWWAGGWLLYAAGFSLLLASVIALKQDSLKKRLAYSTIGQLAYVLLALGLFTPLGVVAAVAQLVAHAFGKITLFFCAGAIATASDKHSVSELNGLGRRMPWTFAAFTLATFSMIGLPLTAGYQVKHLFMAAIPPEQLSLVTLILYTSALLNAAYLLPVICRAFFCKPVKPLTTDEAPLPCILAMLFTACCTLVLGYALPGLLHGIMPGAGVEKSHPSPVFWLYAAVLAVALFGLKHPLSAALGRLNIVVYYAGDISSRIVGKLHRPTAILARNWEISSTVFYAGLLLGAMLLAFYL